MEANRDLSSKVLSIDFSSDDFAKKMVELINEKKRLYKQQRERDRRNRPMTQAEQREYMIKYLKSQGNNWKMRQLKKLKPDELKEEFDKCVEKVETFIPMNSELEASKLKRTGINLQAEVRKKHVIRYKSKWSDTFINELWTMLKEFTREDLMSSYSRMYPVVKYACQVMLKMKLLDGKMNEVCYKLLKMIEKQAGVRK
ncbi:hypothetical protein Tco_0461636 [Tanacetum coccineum]